MKQLIKYELYKICRKKSTLLVMAVSLMVTVFLFGLPIIRYQTYSKDGVIKGFDGIAFDKEQNAQIAVPLTDEYITDTIKEYQRLSENPDNVGYDGNESFLIGDAYWSYVAPREKLLAMLSANYDNPGETLGYNNRLPKINFSTETDFYKARTEKIEKLLNTQSRNMSEKQKEYWRDMSSHVEVPLQYGYYESFEIIMSSFELFMFAILAVCIALAPVFAGEYQNGTAAVILTGKYGKTKLITAKIVSSFVFGITAFSMHIILASVMLFMAFGIDGFSLPLQIANTIIPYPLTFLQATLICFLIVYLVLAAMMALTLLLSAKLKTPYIVLTVLIPVLFIPMFLSPNGTTGVYNLLLFQLPYRAVMPEISKYISYQFGEMVLDVLSVRAILYTVLVIIMLPLAGLSFKKHQVSA